MTSALILSSFAEGANASHDTQQKEKAVSPSDVLPDGMDGKILENPFTGEKGFARKGIIVATELNSIRLTELLSMKTPTKQDVSEFLDIMNALQKRVQSLTYTGIFDWFTPKEWMRDLDQKGRYLVAYLYEKDKKKAAEVDIKPFMDSIPEAWKEIVQSLVKDNLSQNNANTTEQAQQKNDGEVSTNAPSRKIASEHSLLPDGVDYIEQENPFTGEKGRVRKGTIYAVMVNMVAAQKKFDSQSVTTQDLKKIEADMQPYLDGIYTSGIFHLFSLEEWVSNPDRQGRIFIALIMAKYKPALITDKVKSTLKTAIPAIHNKSLQDEVRKLLAQ